MFLFLLLIKMLIALLTILLNDTLSSFLTDPRRTPASRVVFVELLEKGVHVVLSPAFSTLYN